MKFTAEFDSVNSADIAASAIRSKISDFSSVTVHGRDTDAYRESKMMLFPSFNPSNSDPMYAMPVTMNGEYRNENEVSQRSHTTLEVICRNNDSKAVSAMIIGYGGRNITVSK